MDDRWYTKTKKSIGRRLRMLKTKNLIIVILAPKIVLNEKEIISGCIIRYR